MDGGGGATGPGSMNSTAGFGASFHVYLNPQQTTVHDEDGDSYDRDSFDCVAGRLPGLRGEQSQAQSAGSSRCLRHDPRGARISVNGAHADADVPYRDAEGSRRHLS